ncbi:MAG: site-specific integrase [Paramuribaculum sp.]|nr:site-specific integrase [Paramuribaculum sp.]MDE5836601.1 site-specific integrase [Paramuribaculum sp.]
MDKYRYRVNFRLEKRKDKNGNFPDELPINADITFSGKRIWYYSGYRIAPAKWDDRTQRVKRNNFNSEGVSAVDINQRLVKIAAAVDKAFSQLELKEDEVSTGNVRQEIKIILDEEKVDCLTACQAYKILIDERAKEINETPATAKWAKATLAKHKTILNHLTEYRATLSFEDIDDESLYKLELFLVNKGFSNSYVFKCMRDVKTFLNWATKKGYNRNLKYQSYQQRFHDETTSDTAVNHFALTPDELQSIMTFPTHREAIDRARDIFVFCCFTGLRFSEVIALKWSNLDGDILDTTAQKTGQRKRIPLAEDALRILAKYPPAPDEPDPSLFPKISNQKFNAHMKEVGKLAGLTGDWIIETQNGRTRTRKTVKKYEVLASHCGRRTFTTLCLRKGMSPEDIRAVTGHTTAGMMMKYVKFDDESKREKMNLLNDGQSHGVETVFEHSITEPERMRLGIPTRETYLEFFEGDTASVNAHLAVLAHMRGNLEARANYIKRLPTDKLNEVLEIIMKL